MKTFNSLLYALIAMFVLAGCKDDETFQPGGAEDPNCYGVYFPTQTNATDMELDPADATKLTFTVKRTKSEDAITVPVVIKSSEEGIFTASEIDFADGQEETTFEVSFPTAAVGETYKCSIQVDDPKYASIYGEKVAGIDFSVTRVKWNDLGTGKWRDDLFSSAFNLPGTKFAEKDVLIQERADKPGYYRIKDIYDNAFIAKLFGGNYGGFTSSYTILDATDPDKIYLPEQWTGRYVGDDGVLGFASQVPENGFGAGKDYSTNSNGIFTFPKQGVLVKFESTPGDWYYGNSNDMLRISLPGAKAYDYSLQLTGSEPADGKVNIGAKFGADVAKVKYAFFNGSINAAVAEGYSGNIQQGDVESKEITATGIIEATFDATGIYSIVANVYNTAGELKGYQYLSFGYIKAGDDKPVIATVGLDLTNQNAAQGHTKENSVLAYIYGKEVVSGYMGLFATADLAGMTDLKSVVLQYGNKLPDAGIADINGKGFSTFITGLDGGTSYTLIVWLSNGYVGTVLTSKISTEGKPSPLNGAYTLNDLIDEQPTKDGYSKAWNYYAVDAYDDAGSTTRAKVGTVSIVDNTTDDITGSANPDDDADFMDITGLSGLTTKNLGAGKTDKMLIEYLDGWLMSYSDQFIGMYNNTYYLKNLMTCVENTKAYTADWALVGGQIADGYIAFVANPNYIKQGITFKGMVFLAYEDAAMTSSKGGVTSFYDMMLVDPAVDTNSASSAVPATVRALHSIASVASDASNFVELRGRERLKALIKEFAGKPANKALKTVSAPMPNLGVAKAAVTFKAGAELPKSNMGGLQKISAQAVLVK